MKTEIEITIPKTIRFDGWHCAYECDMICDNDDGVMCELFDRRIGLNNYKISRLQACVKKYGVGDEN